MIPTVKTNKRNNQQTENRMTKRVTLIGGTGLTGNGKTTFLDLLAILLNISSCGGRIVRAEMSKIIARALKMHGPVGDEVRKFKPLMDAGGYLPDHIALPVFELWLNTTLGKHNQIEGVLAGGVPRTIVQKKKIKELFRSNVIIDIKIDPDHSLVSIMKRLEQAGSEVRADDAGGIPVFQNRLAEFNNYTVPMLNSCNGELIRLSREQQLEERLEQTLVHIREMEQPVLPKNVVTKALNRLYSRNHQVHGEIRNVIDGKGITPGLIAYV